MKSISKFYSGFIAVISLLMSASVWASHPAEVLVKDTITKTLERLEKDDELIKKDPNHVLDLIEELILPNFDFEQIASWALGKYNRTATATQKEKFTAEFRQLLVRTYSKALVEAKGRVVNYLPVRASTKNTDEVEVRTEVEQGSALPLPIYYKLHLKENEWKVYDVSIDNISIVSNYRNTFAKEIRQDGIDKLISRLAA